ncbi:dolichyl-diphosphooligosaccharide--protein glycosyltransferase subunit STT3 [Cyberlindnera jadinii NRRL Y-1542]|uniref:Dolichyl-diphosphooligosaccharide--protein glycosyltransferase subunit STT3 n=1 Tax=Cyberlindnera jadinii (strain ATCC 18201 / CBS 1600 / BCRC 20928 / JCM 3617 / NBRC 0987 / NRRL Y-1542) TaxID=983966 RepID=A0A1E4RX89_CYBJN|nr:STT3 subunit of Oligosaccharyl transferase [Cyberlindnera jadinii NRRL Y-1542]ODV71883.1 STT3 subunit of Oligosaccharyl transferase [Cyberlindnera jadinii NRRL Y-1542]
MSVEVSEATLANIKLLLRVTILFSIAAAAVSSRLFSVVRFESIIHEFDPWFNFRATKYLVSHSYYEFLNWFDDKTWYPLGRVTGGTLYPGLMVTAGSIWHGLRKIGLPVDIRNICVMLAPAFSGVTAYFTYLFTAEIKDKSAGLLAAAFMGIAPGYISRSVAGSYDNEAIAITLLMTTFYFWIKASKEGSVFWAAWAAGFYFYMVSAWGGYVFITNLIPLHVFILILMGRYSHKLYTAYSTWYAIGTLASMQIPFVGFLPIRSNDHMAALGVFGLIQIVCFGEYIRSKVPSNKFKSVLFVSVILIILLGIAGLVSLTYAGLIAPWTGRFYSLWDTNYAKIHIPIIASVSEHQPTAWPSFFFDTQFLIWLFPAGIFLLFQELRNEHIFVIAYSVLCSYFAGVMVRLMLTLTPIICVSAAVAVSKLFDVYLDFSDYLKEDKTEKPKDDKKSIFDILSKFAVVGTFVFYLYLFVFHCTWVTSNAYSSPSVVLATKAPDGSQQLIDDYREAYYWLRMNTPEDAKVAAWWDYGYQIGGMADRTTLVDNNTWNNTHIATVGKAMCSNEEVAYKVLKQHDVDYVLIIFGGMLGFSGDDLNKFLWMIRIAQGIWPDEVKERSFFTERGEYKVGREATQTMKDSLLYKMSYHRFVDVHMRSGRPAVDRVRSQVISEEPELNVVEEAFTSENWLVRIYKVKDLDNAGRDLREASSFERQAAAGIKKRTAKRPALDIRE